MINLSKLGFLALIALAGMGYLSHLDACTGLKLTAKDGAVVNGRTLEFGVRVDISATVVPREYEFIGTTPRGAGLRYKAKYAAVGAIAFDQVALMDGLNEKGLSVGTFYFPGFASYAEINSENQSKALSPIEFSNWLLTQFASIEEIKSALASVVIAPTVSKSWGNQVPPFHYIVYDKNGNSLVIEPVNGKLAVYDNNIGVFTNSPGFDWHMTNLRNFINLTPFNVKPVKLNGMEFAPFGQGSGMVGMPGDFTPPSRFVRAAIYSATAMPSANSEEAVFQAFHILNQFDIPVGIAREKDGDVIHTDYTLITCVKEPQQLKYYFKTYEDQNIKVIDLNKFDLNAKAIKKRAVGASATSVVDISSDLK